MGGTFDPIHNGHLRTALEIQQTLQVGRVALMPAKQPVHRESPGSSATARLKMVELAVADEPALMCDPREILAEQPSYTIYTLEALRKELGADASVCMVIGMDSFLSFDTWHRYAEFLTFCHIIVVARPGFACHPNKALAQLLADHQVKDKHALLTEAAGSILILELTPLSISATEIRRLLQQGVSPRYLLPDSVLTYIQHNKLYYDNAI